MYKIINRYLATSGMKFSYILYMSEWEREKDDYDDEHGWISYVRIREWS